MKNRRIPLRGMLAGALLAAAALLGGCWWNASPAKINGWIDEGKAEKALKETIRQLEAAPDSPALNLLEAKARMALCAQTSCTLRDNGGTLLQPVEKLLRKAGHKPVTLDPKNPENTLTSQQALASVLPQFLEMENQPKPLLALLNRLPDENHPQVMNALYQPALRQVRQGAYAAAAQYLADLSTNSELGQVPNAFAQALAGMLSNQENTTESHIIQLRSAAGNIPGGEMALLPWALLTQGKFQEGQEFTGYRALEMLPSAMGSWQIGHLVTEESRAGLAAEINTIRTMPQLLALWAEGWPQQTLGPDLMLQRMSLNLNPNQPQLWAGYLPAFVRAVSGSSAVELDGLAMSTISATGMSVQAQQKLVGQLLQTAQQLAEKPAAATPLVTFAGLFSQTKEQEVQLEKLVQDLLIRAGEQSDVTSTLSLALFRPEVAQSNRQTVLPLLVADIRRNLHTGAFEKAVQTAETLTGKLKMDIELAPIILEEFAQEMRDARTAGKLLADSPEYLLLPEEEAQMDLGPLFGFMQEYFAGKPEVVTSQLTTLVAGAQGAYGQSTLMYRLGSLFPQNSEQTPAKRRNWINQALTRELLDNNLLNAPQLASIGAQLAATQPGLPLAPLLEAAVRRAATLEEERQIWQQASASTRSLLVATYPQYASFMRALDAQDANHLNTAASAFAELNTPQWKAKAAPFVLLFQKRLADLAGTYVPVSAEPSVKTAAIVVKPLGLEGGPLSRVELTFINRMGTYQEENIPAPFTATPNPIKRATVTTSLDFDAAGITLTPEVLATLPQTGNFHDVYGNITHLSFGKSGGGNVLTVTADDAAQAYTRATATVTQPLKPDGTYLLQRSLNKGQQGTETILPVGAMLHFTTTSDLQAPLAEWNAPESGMVYALTGDVIHPSVEQPIPFVGFFDPLTLALQFNFSYALPQSGQPIKAAVRCQALAGPLICGSHHLHSPRRPFATLVAGMQTRESLAEQATIRAQINTENRANMLKALDAAALAASTQPVAESIAASSTQLPIPAPAAVSSTGGLLSPVGTQTSSTSSPAAAPSPALPAPVVAAPPAPATPSAVTSTAGTSPTASSLQDEEEEEKQPNTFTPSGIVTGAFVHKTSSPTVTSPTVP